MPEILTESFCERCGTRYTFQAAAPSRSRLSRLKIIARGLRNYVLSDDTTLEEAFADARSDEEREISAQQLEAFHQTFNFCLSCRQYTCANCWNEAEGRCLTCAPDLSREPLPAPFPTLQPTVEPIRPAVEVGGDGEAAWPARDLGLEAAAGTPTPTPEAPPTVEPPPAPAVEAPPAVEPMPAGTGTDATRLPETVPTLEAAPIPDAAEAPPATAPSVPSPLPPGPAPAAPPAADRAAAAAEQTAALLARFRPPPAEAPTIAEAEPPSAPPEVAPRVRAPAPPEAPPVRPAAHPAPVPSEVSATPAPAPTDRVSQPVWPPPRPAAGPTPPPAWPPAPLATRPSGHALAAEAVWAESSRDVLAPRTGGVQACIACGLPLSATARFCRRCGSPQQRS